MSTVTPGGILACDIARDIAIGLADAREAASNLATVDGDVSHKLARDLGLASNLASDLASNLTRGLHNADDIALARALASHLASNLARARAHALAHGLGLADARDLDHDLINHHNHALRIVDALDRAPFAWWQSKAGRMMPLAGRLLAGAARLLPADDRTRYAEEFRSELAEIAATGTGRRPQLAYAFRQVASAWRLRADLRSPRRRGAVP